MQMLGWDMGPCRLPLATLDREIFDEFYRELDALSFFDKVGSRKVKYPA
jgi:N-acetylneuraminate lyase